MKTIIVPTDFSSISINAAYYATDMAAAIHSNVLLVHIISLPFIISEIPMAPDSLGIMTADAELRIEKLKEELKAYANNKVSFFTLVQIGDLPEELDEISKQTYPFAIVMGTQGETATQELLLGSKTLATIRKLSYPLIVIPPKAHFNNIKKICLASDLKNVKDTIPAKSIEGLINTFNCSIDIIYVSKADEKMNPAVLNESINLQDQLQKLHPKIHYLLNNNIETGISQYASQNNIDMVVVIPKKHDFLDSIIHKSISKEIAVYARVPIMILKSITYKNKSTKANPLINLFTL